MAEDIQVGRFKGHSAKSGKDYTYYRIKVRDAEGKYWVSDYLFPRWTPADADGNPVSMRPSLNPL